MVFICVYLRLFTEGLRLFSVIRVHSCQFAVEISRICPMITSSSQNAGIA